MSAKVKVGDAVIVRGDSCARVIDAPAGQRWVTVRMHVLITELEVIEEGLDVSLVGRG